MHRNISLLVFDYLHIYIHKSKSNNCKFKGEILYIFDISIFHELVCYILNLLLQWKQRHKQCKYCIEQRMFNLNSLPQIIFSCDQAALKSLLSARPSVCYTFFTMFLSLYHHEIFRSYYHWQKWCPRKRSRSEVKDQGHKCQYKFCPNFGVSGL